MGVQKKLIGVFFGGCSSEYEVSLQSAYSVLLHIDTERYTPVMIGIGRDSGQWFRYLGDAARIPVDTWYSEDSCIPVTPTTDRKLHGIQYVEGGLLRTISLDAALPVLHGRNGEDGTVQGILELAGIPVIGCGVLSSALCMDKVLSHKVVAAQGILAARSVLVEKPYEDSRIEEAARELGYPLFVKPVRAGSSFGITKVMSKQELSGAVEYAFGYDSMVMLEETVAGFEVGCAVLGTREPVLGAVDEIEISEGFFDYTEKYTLKSSFIHVPARIPEEKAAEIKKTALAIYRALGCSCFARVDLFLTPEGKIYFNEVNTIPGFTTHSRYPNMLREAGLSFGEVVGRLLDMGVRHGE